MKTEDELLQHPNLMKACRSVRPNFFRFALKSDSVETETLKLR